VTGDNLLRQVGYEGLREDQAVLRPARLCRPRHQPSGEHARQSSIGEIDRQASLSTPRDPEDVIAHPSAPQFSSSQAHTSRLRLLLLSRGIPAQSSVRCRASPALRDFGTSAADFLPVQKGPETVGLDGDDAVAAVCVRFGGFVTFSCPLSRLAAVQGSSLIVSLPRFVRRVE